MADRSPLDLAIRGELIPRRSLSGKVRAELFDLMPKSALCFSRLKLLRLCDIEAQLISECMEYSETPGGEIKRDMLKVGAAAQRLRAAIENMDRGSFHQLTEGLGFALNASSDPPVSVSRVSRKFREDGQFLQVTHALVSDLEAVAKFVASKTASSRQDQPSLRLARGFV